MFSYSSCKAAAALPAAVDASLSSVFPEIAALIRAYAASTTFSSTTFFLLSATTFFSSYADLALFISPVSPANASLLSSASVLFLADELFNSPAYSSAYLASFVNFSASLTSSRAA